MSESAPYIEGADIIQPEIGENIAFPSYMLVRALQAYGSACAQSGKVTNEAIHAIPAGETEPLFSSVDGEWVMPVRYRRWWNIGALAGFKIAEQATALRKESEKKKLTTCKVRGCNKTHTRCMTPGCNKECDIVRTGAWWCCKDRSGIIPGNTVPWCAGCRTTF